MKIEHKALIFALGLAVVMPACTIVTEKPADSTPALSPTPPATAVPVAAATAAANPTPPPLATGPMAAKQPLALTAAPKPAPATTATTVTP